MLPAGLLFLIFFNQIQPILVTKNGNDKRIECQMILQFLFLFHYACAKSSIFFYNCYKFELGHV